MSERIRQLEDALAIFQAGISHERHPLLRDELLTIKFGPEVRRTVDEEHNRDILSSNIDALGTLTIGEHGESKYFGRSAGSEVGRALLLRTHVYAACADHACVQTMLSVRTLVCIFQVGGGIDCLAAYRQLAVGTALTTMRKRFLLSSQNSGMLQYHSR